MENKKYYCGRAKHKGDNKYLVDLNLTQLRVALSDPDIQNRIHEYESKIDGTQQTIRLWLDPLREPNQYSTHSLKVVNWDSKQDQQQPDNPAQKKYI